MVKYPATSDVASNQGVGPHFDSGFLTFVRSKLYLPSASCDSELTLISRSCYRRHRTMGSRCRTFQATGLTCHPFLEHSLLISARVSAFVPFLSDSAPIPENFYRRFGDGHLWAHACNVPPGSIAPGRINSPIFDPVFPEHRSKSAVERDSVGLYVLVRLRQLIS